MKKFSKYTNSPVGEDPKPNIDKSLNEVQLFKAKVFRLMDDFLRVQTYGPVTRYQVAGLMKVSGKELFIEALMDLLNDNKSKEEIKILESLKSEILDWGLIDSKIDDIKSKNCGLYSQRFRIRSLYEMYKNDEEMLLTMVGQSIDKISDEERRLRFLACDGLTSDIKEDVLNKIRNIYMITN